MADTSPPKKPAKTGGRDPPTTSKQQKQSASSTKSTPKQDKPSTPLSTPHSTQHKPAPQAQQGKIKIRLVGPGHDPSMNKAWMGDMPVLGPGMVPALSPPGADVEREVREVRERMGKGKKVKLVKGGW